MLRQQWARKLGLAHRLHHGPRWRATSARRCTTSRRSDLGGRVLVISRVDTLESSFSCSGSARSQRRLRCSPSSRRQPCRASRRSRSASWSVRCHAVAHLRRCFRAISSFPGFPALRDRVPSRRDWRNLPTPRHPLAAGRERRANDRVARQDGTRVPRRHLTTAQLRHLQGCGSPVQRVRELAPSMAVFQGRR